MLQKYNHLKTEKVHVAEAQKWITKGNWNHYYTDNIWKWIIIPLRKRQIQIQTQINHSRPWFWTLQWAITFLTKTLVYIYVVSPLQRRRTESISTLICLSKMQNSQPSIHLIVNFQNFKKNQLKSNSLSPRKSPSFTFIRQNIYNQQSFYSPVTFELKRCQKVEAFHKN